MAEKKFVSNSDIPVRIFRNSFYEFLSRVHFIVPVIIYIPVAGWFLYHSIFVSGFPLLTVFLFFLSGAAAWTLTEYLLHRFVFHWVPPGKIGKRLHFFYHGVHHDYPSDSRRLVMVPTFSIPLSLLFYYLFTLILGVQHAAPFFAGFIVGYLFYDMTHYALHHYNFKSKFWLSLKNHHMVHHYKDEQHGFGVSSKFWDMVFHTMFK